MEQKYRVLSRLEAGGMAEVFKGEAASFQGFKKTVAIKRVLPHLAQNQNFMAMFLDEARLGARLNHANIVTVFDIGSSDETYFIVMEFIDGMNLKKVMENLRQHGRPFPLKEALYIAIEACRGLSYAHETTGEDGEHLGVVHRDISPPNILLSNRGEVKLTDFGLAKASTQLEKTDPGVVKGKFSYLSPEAAHGRDVDARTDIFSLGIILWEMLTGRRLFLGDSDYDTVKKVQACEIPSLSALNPDVDQELEAIIGRALTSDLNARYQSARDFGDALTAYLFGNKLKVTSYDIAALIKGIAKQRKEKSESSMIDKLIADQLMVFRSLDSAPSNVGQNSVSTAHINGAERLEDSVFTQMPTDDWDDDTGLADLLEGDMIPERPSQRSLAGDPIPLNRPKSMMPPAATAPKSSNTWLWLALIAVGIAGSLAAFLVLKA